MEIPHMKKRALIVGINYTGTGNALKGCLNDAEHMQAHLAARGFTEIKSVLEKEATTAGITAGLNWLVADTAPGDVIVFHYSGHGSQLPSKSEADGFEEIICPVDLNWTDKVITDNTLRQIFDKVPNGVNTTLILDCCHSGTMLDQTESLNGTKEVKPTKPTKGSRYLKPPAKIKKQLANCTLVNWETSKDVNATALLIAGCHANQTSADAFIDGKAQGAATASLIAASTANTTISYRNLTSEMVGFMEKNNFKQVPELDGSESLYDQTFLEPFSFAIPSTPVIDTPAGPVVEPSANNNMKPLLIIGAVIALIVLFLVFG
jgi:uncharacterized caspase-like protein